MELTTITTTGPTKTPRVILSVIVAPDSHFLAFYDIFSLFAIAAQNSDSKALG